MTERHTPPPATKYGLPFLQRKPAAAFGRTPAPPPVKFGPAAVQPKTAPGVRGPAPRVVQRSSASALPDPKSDPKYQTTGAGGVTKQHDYANAWHSAEESSALILPEGSKRKSVGVSIAGVGDGTAYGIGAYGHAGGVPTKNGTQSFSDDEREAVDKIGYASGCHQCGSKDPKSASGHFVPDHQPPLSKWGSLSTYSGTLYPHCSSCSSKQGGILSAAAAKK